MRRQLVVLGLASLLAAASAGAWAQSDAPAPAPAPAAAPTPAALGPAGTAPVSLVNPVLGYYPAAARAAGVEGQVVLSCRRDEHLALTGCTLVSETPAGQGFGAAALAMAARSPQNPKLVLKDAAAEPASDLTVQFTLRPPYISPDITRMAHIVKVAEIVSKPTDAQIQSAYPPRALDDQVQGGAVIECAVTLVGKLAECSVYAEQPTGYGFGQAALDLAGDFVLKPRLVDGDPVSGSPVRISVAFTSQSPDAPLSLQTKPAEQQHGGFYEPPKQ